MPYNTPDGFFEEMRKDLLAIPHRLTDELPMRHRSLVNDLLIRHRSLVNDLPIRRNGLADKLLRGRQVISWHVAGTALGALAAAALAVFVLLRQPSDGGLDACAEDVLAATMQVEQIEEYLADSGISVYQLTDYLD